MATSHDSPLVGWRTIPPHDRGTYNIISVCASTLIICSWNAVHIDVPKRRTWRSTTGTRILWFLIGIFFPEVLLMFAVGQYLRARRVTAYVHSQPGYRKSFWARWWTRAASGPTGNTWTMKQSFYGIMGGFPHIDPDSFRGTSVYSVVNSPAGASAGIIKDTGKAGPMAKALLCTQIVFFCANCAVRINQHLPLSLLEITTIAHALCALCAYAVWWDKPQDVDGEAPLRNERKAWEYLPDALFLHYTVDTKDTTASCELFLAATVISALYGCPHLLGLHIRFPTSAERGLWIFSTTIVISAPILFIGLLALANVIPPKIYDGIVKKAGPTVFVVFGVVPMVIYPIASAFLVAESIRQLFALPEAAFKQPQWTQYIPHFS